MNKKKVIIIVMCIVMCLMVVGYGAFNTLLTITGTANIASEWKVVFTNITQVSKTSGVNVKATPVASGTSATFNVGLTSPGDKIVYKITLANQGTIDAVIRNIEASASDSPAIIFTIDGVNTGDVINKKTSKDFTVTIEYDPYVTSQPEKLEKTLSVSITTEQKVNQNIENSTPNVNQPTYLSSAILKNNIAQSDANIDFSKTSEETGTNGLYYTSTNTENNQITYYFRGAVENNYVKLGSYYVTELSCKYNGQPTWSVTDLENMYATDTPTEEQCLSTNVCDAGTLIKEAYGVDVRYVTGVDDATCAYMGGTPTGKRATYRNDVIVDRLWRIVRINEDGSVRIITQDDVGESAFNTSNDDNAYVGYMYGTTGQSGNNAYNLTHSNDNPSTIKEFLDDWYEENLSSYSSYLADAGFCNDRSVAPSAGLWKSDDTALGYARNYTVYGAAGRLVNFNNYTGKENAQPQFKCPNESTDLFTTSSSSKGNKELTNPIGLITADEIAYAGAVYNTYSSDESMYLSGGYTLTMSPFYFKGSYANAWVVDSGGKPSHIDVEGGHDVRPVVNLRSGVEIIGGDGTSGNPYIIKTN